MTTPSLPPDLIVGTVVGTAVGTCVCTAAGVWTGVWVTTAEGVVTPVTGLETEPPGVNGAVDPAGLEAIIYAEKLLSQVS